MKTLKTIFGNYQLKRNWLALFAVFVGALMLSACQYTTDNVSEDTGELTIELTDAEGDFSTYSVDVLSITLTKLDNTVVEVLPENTRVDFAQYVEMSELLSSSTIPSGVYTSATLTLDYSNAEIFAENANGDNIRVTSIVDEDNQAITTLKTSVTLDDRNRLRIAPGVPAHLSLDFDLKTSNVVNFDDAAAPVLTVAPILNASLEPDLDKTHRVRGPLKKVDLANSSFDLIIRPFNQHFSEKREHFGNFRVNISENTTFEINGANSTGSDGLAAMESLDKLTAIIVVGDISLRPKRFHATQVYAGSSVPGGDLDAVKGTVLSRVDNTFVVKGATLIRVGGSVLFNDEVSVTVDTTTIVKRENDDGDYAMADISVGQKVTIFGELNDDTADPALDATNGLVRMLITTISGTVVSEKDSANTQPFAIDLSNIGGRKIDIFDFSGTGTETANDADPMFYEVETSTLNLAAFPLNTVVSVKGFVNSFGQAPADFIAKSIISTSKSNKLIKSVMHADWKPASATAFSMISNEKITLDFTDAGRFHHIGAGRHKVDLTTLETAFSFVPPAEGQDAIYVVQMKGNRHVHTSFENLANDLNSLMAAGNAVSRVQATGTFDLATGEFSSKMIKLKLK